MNNHAQTITKNPPALLALALLVSVLPIGAAPAWAAGDTGDFNVTGNGSYAYNNGVLTVNDGANITISMASDATTPTSDRIVVAENATATITLAGVNIKGSDRDGAQNIAAKSAIDLSNGSILTIDLSANAENTLTGGSGSTDGSGAPGIHVPDSASLIIQGEGSLSVSGGTSSTAFCGVGIGGNASTTSAGEACGTVIIFASDNVTITAGQAGSGSDSADDIGGGNGQYQNNGDDGQGIRPGTNGNYTVYGNLTLPCDITIPNGATVTIPDGTSLTVPQGVTLTNNGNITGAGSVTVSGDVSGSGSMSVTGTVTKKEQAAPNAPSSTTDVTDTSVTLSAVTDTGGIGGIEYGYTTGGETSVPEERWQDDLVFDGLQPVTSYTFYARYAGNDYYEPSPASGGLTVTTEKSDAELGNLTVSGHTGFEDHFQYGDTITVTFTPERKANTSTNVLSLEEDTATLSYTPTGGETVTLATATAQTDGSFELSYDTKKKRLPIGENLTLDKAILKNMPTVSGNFVYGETLTANYTKQDDETVTYQWYRSGEIISGATEASYTLTAEDIGKNILVEIIATDEWHRGKMRSIEQEVSKATGSIAIACDSVTVGEKVSPTVTSNTNEGANVTYSYSGTGSTSYGPSSKPPTAAGSYTVTATAAETATHTQAASAPVAFSISKAEQSAPAAPTLASRSSHSLTVNAIAASASGAPAEYSIDGGQTWQRETTFTGLSAATSYEIVARYAETDSHSASPASAALTARTASSHSPSTPEGPSSPSTGDSSGWDAILDQLENAENGKITIDMGDETKVPEEIFESLAGKDVDVTFDLGNVQWSVSGADIPTDADFTDLDLRVDLDTSGIPVNVINTITGEIGTVQITLAHDGEFGFTMTLTAPLGKENAGYWANLYHYDERAEAMNFEAAAEIDQDGSVTIPFTHASQYAIVIDTHSHAAVDVSDLFIDVAPNAWYKDAVQYAYAGGLMTGVSANEFAPEATTTRAMIVSILARLEGVESAEAAGFIDVSADDWYATAVNWAASAGIVSGTGDGNFSPNAAITREQLAAMLMNYSAWKGEDVSARADFSAYSDQPSTWATETMQWAVAEGLISGVTSTELQPQGNATRAQVAAILQRFFAQ